MTREETKMIVNGMMVGFPNYKPSNLGAVVDLWSTMLVDYDYKVVSAALASFIATDTRGFAPTIGQLLEQIPTGQKEIDPLKAWALVTSAIRNGYYGAEEEYAKLPELVQRAVGDPKNLRSWSMLKPDEVHTVAQAQFLRSYRALQERDRKEARIPKSVKAIIEQATLKLEQKEEVKA